VKLPQIKNKKKGDSEALFPTVVGKCSKGIEEEDGEVFS